MVAIKNLRTTELFGWYGASALICAYFLVSFDLTTPEGLFFQLLNVTGGVALVIFSLSKKAKQLAILNAFWALIGVVAILKSFM